MYKFRRQEIWRKKQKLCNAHQEYATKELQTIDTVIARESEEKTTLLRETRENLTETLKIMAELNEEMLITEKRERD